MRMYVCSRGSVSDGVLWRQRLRGIVRLWASAGLFQTMNVFQCQAGGMALVKVVKAEALRLSGRAQMTIHLATLDSSSSTTTVEVESREQVVCGGHVPGKRCLRVVWC
jgi:hypothetical protein